MRVSGVECLVQKGFGSACCPSVTGRLFVTLTWDPVREGAERHNSLLLPLFGARVWPILVARATFPREHPCLSATAPLGFPHPSPSHHRLLHLCLHPPPCFPALQSGGSGPWPCRPVHVTHRGQGTLSVTVFPSCFPSSGLWGFSMRPK